MVNLSSRLFVTIFCLANLSLIFIPIQNSAVRIVFHFLHFNHGASLFKSLHWLPFLSRIQHKLLVMTSKAIHGLDPPHLSSLISPDPFSYSLLFLYHLVCSLFIYSVCILPVFIPVEVPKMTTNLWNLLEIDGNSTLFSFLSHT